MDVDPGLPGTCSTTWGQPGQLEQRRCHALAAGLVLQQSEEHFALNWIELVP